MKNLFVPYELAFKLSEKGFNDKCIGFFRDERLIFPVITGDHLVDNEFFKGLPLMIAAPLFEQVINWFRIRHNIYIAVLPYREDSELCWYYIIVEDDEQLSDILLNEGDLNASSNYKNYEDALLEGIKAGLNLI